MDAKNIDPVFGISIPKQDFDTLKEIVEDTWLDVEQGQIILPLDTTGEHWVLIQERRN